MEADVEKAVLKAENALSRNRDEIEEDLKLRGFKLLYEWKDDQIWTDKENKVLIWISWLTSLAFVYGFTKEIDLRG